MRPSTSWVLVALVLGSCAKSDAEAPTAAGAPALEPAKSESASAAGSTGEEAEGESPEPEAVEEEEAPLEVAANAAPAAPAGFDVPADGNADEGAFARAALAAEIDASTVAKPLADEKAREKSTDDWGQAAGAKGDFAAPVAVAPEGALGGLGTSTTLEFRPAVLPDAGGAADFKKQRALDKDALGGEADRRDQDGDDDGIVTPDAANRRAAGQARAGRTRATNQALVAEPDMMLDFEDEAPVQFQKPQKFLPRMAYFENTYLGGNAAHQQMVRQVERDLGSGERPWREAYATAQPFDPPSEQALALSATLDRRWVDREGPVYLQVGVQGSRRYGWRRPPLDLVLVVDGQVLGAGTAATDELVGALLRSLGPQDRLGIVVAGADSVVVSEVEPVKGLRTALAERLQRLASVRGGDAASLERAIDAAGALLQTASQAQARVPGSQVTLVAVAGDAPDGGLRAQSAARAAHRLTLQGAMTSVVELGVASEGPYWQVAAAGHGNYHRAAAGEEAQVVSTELELLAKVVARLLRINIRLAPGSSAVRILGSRVLGAEQVRQVKAREVATDLNLSRTMGVAADRGEDDDGLQTVIPYYYGGDSHVILIELWVDGPGAVADVTLRYKDMVTLDNATARASVHLAATPRAPLPEQLLVRRNLQGFALADALRGASAALSRNDTGSAMSQLNAANHFARNAADARVITGFENLVRESAGDPAAAEPVWRAMGVAARQRVGLQRE